MEKKLELADRELVENHAERILDEAEHSKTAFLVVGDAFGATTHCDLAQRAYERGIRYEVIHNASILNSVGVAGLQLYNFGQTVSIVFYEGNWRPTSFYDKIRLNINSDLHTLCLLDIKMKERSIENIIRDKKIYEKPRFMTINQALETLNEIEAEKKQNGILAGDARFIHTDTNN